MNIAFLLIAFEFFLVDVSICMLDLGSGWQTQIFLLNL